MANIFLPPSSTDPVVKVGGICYKYKQDSNIEPDTFIWEGFASCEECLATPTPTPTMTLTPTPTTTPGLPPLTCPCSPWPPISWPCGGLNQTYTIDNGLLSKYDSTPIYGKYLGLSGKTYEYRILSPLIVYADVLNSCQWKLLSAVPNESRIDGGSWSPDVGVDITVRGYWDVAVSTVFPFAAIKSSGSTPVGTYFWAEEWTPGEFYDHGYIVS